MIATGTACAANSAIALGVWVMFSPWRNSDAASAAGLDRLRLELSGVVYFVQICV
jgi:hypothetical protein